MCGIVASLSQNDVNQDIYEALIALQHRGQDALVARAAPFHVVNVYF